LEAAPCAFSGGIFFKGFQAMQLFKITHPSVQPGSCGSIAPAIRSSFALLWLCLMADGVQARCADLALVLAIDASGSIDEGEFALQQSGYADAFRSDSVQAALNSAGVVDVAVVLWGDSAMPVQVLPWHRLDRAAGATQLAAMIESAPRRVNGNTAIGSGIWVALDLLDDPARCADRSVINVSGDGVESLGPRPDSVISLHHARERAMATGVTINALAISGGNERLVDWFRKSVVTGPGSFVMQVAFFSDFADAIAAKLSREIRAPALAALRMAPAQAQH
jgi:hypothetical protein